MNSNQLKISFLALMTVGAWLLSSVFAPLCAAETKPYRITMVVFRGCEDACLGFKNYWVDNKIPVEIEVLDAKTNAQLLPGFVKHVNATKPDLLVTWGTTVSLAMLGTTDHVDPAKHVTEVPALFMIASTPVGSKLVSSLNVPGRNVSGTCLLYTSPSPRDS